MPIVFFLVSIFLMGCCTTPCPIPPVPIKNQAIFVPPPVKATDPLLITAQQPLQVQPIPPKVSKAVSATGTENAAAFPPTY